MFFFGRDGLAFFVFLRYVMTTYAFIEFYSRNHFHSFFVLSRQAVQDRFHGEGTRMWSDGSRHKVRLRCLTDENLAKISKFSVEQFRITGTIVKLMERKINVALVSSPN